MSVQSNGTNGAATSALSCYTILEVNDIGHAAQVVVDCPVLSGGGSIDSYEVLPI
jgi:hypothetical protein